MVLHTPFERNKTSVENAGSGQHFDLTLWQKTLIVLKSIGQIENGGHAPIAYLSKIKFPRNLVSDENFKYQIVLRPQKSVRFPYLTFLNRNF